MHVSVFASEGVGVGLCECVYDCVTVCVCVHVSVCGWGVCVSV